MQIELLNQITEEIIAQPQREMLEGEALKLLEFETEELMAAANRIRRQVKGNLGFSCAIINAKSGKCPQNCTFCAQSAHHDTGVEVYPLLDEELIIKRAHQIKAAGASRFSMVTSGTTLNSEEIERVCRATKRIISETDLSVCGSLGMLNKDKAERLAKSGMSRYHHNLETPRSHFDQICTTHTYDEDIETIKIAREAGMNCCCGCIFGLGESWEQRIELALELRDLDVDCLPLNFLNPVKGTPLGESELLSPMEALRCVALFRIINPQKDITICGGREVTLKDFQASLFMAGANALMIGNYLTTTGRDAAMDIEMLKEAGIKI